jgi:hypothetical protein
MQPEDIGHAAAYEAYRTWIHNSSIYEPLSGDSARQREGLIGLAVAEGNRSPSLLTIHLYIASQQHACYRLQDGRWIIMLAGSQQRLRLKLPPLYSMRYGNTLFPLSYS